MRSSEPEIRGPQSKTNPRCSMKTPTKTVSHSHRSDLLAGIVAKTPARQLTCCRATCTSA
ncbi:hypothetical protein KCP74_02145 [Salmonella enterica subsp. enterica]|nr:hypothetical protein KCP74_02145 [Salmonella enterica subsp. enterica]